MDVYVNFWSLEGGEDLGKKGCLAIKGSAVTNQIEFFDHGPIQLEIKLLTKIAFHADASACVRMSSNVFDVS